MDERLNIVGPQGQLMNVLADDVPELARVITALLLGFGSVSSRQLGSVSVVHLSGPDFDTIVRADDWLKIAPYMADGTFNTIAVASDPANPDLPVNPISGSTVSTQDSALYNRVYGILSMIFTTKYPTSKI